MTNYSSAGIFYHFVLIPFLLSCIIVGCQESHPSNTDDTFFDRQNAAHDGDYIATYPLSNADSCISRLKAEVPESLQPWACLSIWYHMPRTNPAVNFRLLELYEENYPHDTVTAFAQMVRGEFYVEMAQFDSARICLTDSYERYTRLGRPLDASDATYLMARSYLYQNNFADALQSYFELLDMLNELDTGFSHRRAYLYHDISVAYERSSNKPQQLFWLKKMWDADATKLDKPHRYKATVATSLCTYYLTVDPDSSLLWAKKAIDIFKHKNESSLPPPRLVYWLARAYFMKGECEEALPHFMDAYRRNNEMHEVYGYYQYSMVLGECYLCLGQLDSAEVYLKESLATPDTGNLSVAHNLLSEVHAKRGDWESALEEAKESRRLFEIKFTADKVKKVAELEARYENEKKEQRIRQLEQERKSSFQQRIILALSLLLVLGGSVALYLRQRGRRYILEQENLLLDQEKKLAEAESRLKKQALERSQTQLQQTREELDAAAKSLALKNRLIEELKMKLTQPPPSGHRGKNVSVDKSKTFRSMKILTDADWKHFRREFELSFPGYLKDLRDEFPGLTAAETRLFLLIKLDFQKSEIAETLGISRDSVMRSCRRLRKKLGLNNGQDLEAFVHAFYD